jgi:hypothetical protein
MFIFHLHLTILGLLANILLKRQQGIAVDIAPAQEEGAATAAQEEVEDPLVGYVPAPLEGGEDLFDGEASDEEAEEEEEGLFVTQ